MQFKQTLVRLALILIPFPLFSQTTYIPFGDKSNVLIERLEIKNKRDSVLNYSKTRPYSRLKMVETLNRLYYNTDSNKLSRVDRYNLDRFWMNNIEFLADKNRYRSRKPWINNKILRSPANLFEVHQKDFDLIINPVIQVSISKENNNDETLYQNSRGLTLRGKIADRIGFFAYITDNQEKLPMYARGWVNRRKAVPGQGFYKPFKNTGYDYFDARGYITFGATRYIDVTFGYDKNFIGNGHRSLFLGDGSSANLFLKLNTRIWRFNYQNLFMELQSAEIPGGDKLLPKKYAAIHHLDVGITNWLNIGLFEGVIFGRKDHFDFSYLNPIIFYRSIEQQNGSFDNSIVGIDAKANIDRKFQVYGQLTLDELLVGEITKNRGYWGNKYGVQLGAKYIDAFHVSNLDLQLEHNIVRPFTYSHRDSVANYTHYNQPLAHPLGANFSEWIAVARYQPAPKWMMVAKLIQYVQGRDSNSVRSFGSNIFLPNVTPFRTGDYGYKIGSGWKTNVFYGSFLISYEWKENLFIDLSALFRREETKTSPLVTTNTSLFTLGVRWNMQRREIDY
jgi:hypothetical protein